MYMLFILQAFSNGLPGLHAASTFQHPDHLMDLGPGDVRLSNFSSDLMHAGGFGRHLPAHAGPTAAQDQLMPAPGFYGGEQAA